MKVAKVLGAETEVLPNFLTRDAVRGIAEWCRRHGLVTDEDYSKTKPPYTATRPRKPPTLSRLEKKYERRSHEGRNPYGRDIDPTLPPAPLLTDDEEQEKPPGPTFPVSGGASWWTPKGPTYLRTDSVPADWVYETKDLPEFGQMLQPRDESNRLWVVLKAYYN